MTDPREKLALRRTNINRANKQRRRGGLRRFGALSMALSLFFSLGASFIIPANVFAAACAAPTTDLGTVSISVDIPADATYSVWTRMIAADATNNAVNLEIDGNDCYSVGGGTFAQTTWATTGANWVNYANGTPSTPITKALTTGSHTFKYIGTKAGVGVDKLVVTSDTTCMPTGPDGCPTGSTDTTPPTVNLLTPTASQNVSGPVDLTATAADASGIASVKFLVDGQVVGEDTTDPYSFSWNSAALANGTHTVAAQATDKSGLTATSSPVAIVTNNAVICTQPPSVPAGLAVSGTSATSVSLSWSASTPAASCTIKEYNIYRNDTKVTSVTAGTAYDDTGLTPGATFSYTVSAVDTSGHESAKSTAVSATTSTDAQAPEAPGNVHTTMTTSSSIALAWDASTSTDVTSYVVYSNGNQATTSNNTAATVSGLTPDTEYSFTVKARDAAGNLSQASTAITAKTSAGTPGGGGSLYLDPSSGSFAPGATITVSIREDSKAETVNAAHADLTYSAATLEYQAIDANGSDFGVDAAKSGGSGKISIARGNTSPVSGDKLIAKVTFKVLGAGTGTISFDDTSAVLSSVTNENIASQGLGAAYTLAVPTTPPPTTPPPTTPPPATPPPATPPPTTPPPARPPTPPPTTPPPTTRPTTPPTTPPTTTTSKTSSTTNSIAPTGNSQPATLPSGSEVELTDPAVITTTTSNTSSVKKVEYYLNGKLVATVTTPPFSYSVKTNNLRNGKYTLTTKTYYQSGKVDSSTSTINVNNPLNFTQLMLQLQHFAWLLILLALIAGGAIWYFFFRRPAEDDFGDDGFGGDGGGYDPMGGGYGGDGTGTDVPPSPGGQVTPGGGGFAPPGGAPDPYGRY